MRRSLVILAALLFPLFVLMLLLAAAGTPTAVADLEGAEPDILAADIPASGPTIAVEEQTAKRMDLDESSQLAVEPRQLQEADPWRSQAPDDLLSAARQQQQVREEAAEREANRLGNAPPRPEERQVVAPARRSQPGHTSYQTGRPAITNEDPRPQLQSWRPQQYPDPQPTAEEQSTAPAQPFKIAATLVLSPLHRQGGNSTNSSWFVFTNTSGIAANYTLDFYWPNGVPVGSEGGALPSGEARVFSLDLHASFDERPWVGEVLISSDQSVTGKIATPGYGWIAGIVVEDDGVTPARANDVSVNNIHTNDHYGGVYVMNDGRFYLGGLDFDQYEMWIHAGYPWANQWYDGHHADQYEQADPIDVANPDPVAITVTLEPGGRITGTVFAADGTTPLENVNVDADQGGYGTCTNANGKYELVGLPYGQHLVYAGGGWNGCLEQDSDYVLEYYNEAQQEDQATPIAISSTLDTMTGIDFTMSIGGKIAGQVRAADGGAALESVHVEVRDYDSDDHLGDGWTDAGGTYTVTGLLDGDYRVQVSDQSSIPAGLAWQYYDHVINWEAAARVTVSGGGTVAGIDFDLGPAGIITGFVTDEHGTPLAEINVSASVPDTPIGTGTCSDQNGYYEFTALPYETYMVEAGGGWNHCVNAPSQWVRERWEETYDWNAATLLTLDGGNDTYTDINFTLEPGGSISGRVLDEHDNPIENVNVDAHSDSRGTGEGSCTDQDGYYQLETLPYVTDWVVSAATHWNHCLDEENRFIATYYDNQYSYQDADRIEVSELYTTVENINFTVLEGGKITGRVTEAGGGSPIENVQVTAGPYDDQWYNRSAWTNAQGYYTITGLLDDDFRVSVESDIPAGYAQQYYPDSFAQEFAERVGISGFGTASGIDFHLQPGGMITGYIVDDATGLPIADMNVSAGPRHGNGGRGACTDDQGYYELDGLIYADYVVQAPADTRNWCLDNNEPHDVYPMSYYDGVYRYDEATPVTIDGGATLVADINFSLLEGAFIEGVVEETGGSGVPVDGVRMAAVVPGDCPWCHDWVAETDSNPDGTYRLGPLAPGEYAVYACTGCSNHLLVEQFYPDAYHLADATMITIAAGVDRTGINMTLDPGIWLTGTVSVPAGYNPGDVQISAWEQRPDGYGTGRQADGDGEFIVPVPPIFDSQWEMRAEPWGTDLFLQHVADFSLDQTNWDFNLGKESVITGWVTLAGGGVPNGGHINADGRWMNHGESIDQNGYYEIHNLPPGEYTLNFDGWPDYMWTYYQGHEWNFSTPIVLSEEEVETDVNFEVQWMGLLEGYVYDSDGITPVEGAQITAMDGEGMWYGHSQTDGYFAMELPATDVKVLFQPNDWQLHMWGYYSGSRTHAGGEVVSVPPLDQGSANIEIVLERRAIISGQVRDADSGDPLGGILVTALTTDPGVEWGWENAAYTCTEEDGNYHLTGITAGPVEVMALGTCGNDDYGSVTTTLTAVADMHHTVDLTVTAGSGLPDVFTIRPGGEPFGYTPIRARHGMALDIRDEILPLLFAPLVDLNDQGDWYSELLAQVPTEANGGAAVVDGHLEVTYELKPGLKWSDGEALTSADIRFTWEMLTQPRWLLDDYLVQVGTIWQVEEVLTPDPLTAVFIYERETIPPAYLGALTYLMPKHLLDGRHPDDVQLMSHYAHEPIGNGPYVVADWVPGSHMDLVANPNYHKSGDGLPLIREMRLLDNAHPFWSVVGGRVDVSLGAYDRPDDWTTFDVNVYTNTHQGFGTIVPNLTSPLFEDVQVRQALYHALNKEAVTSDPADSYLPPDHPLYNPAITTYDFNLATAEAMLVAAGWTEDADHDGIREKNGLEFEFDLVYNEGNTFRQELLTTFAGDLLLIGIDANVISMPWDEMLDGARRGQLDAFAIGWFFDDRYDPHAYDLYHSRNHRTAYNRYEGSIHNTGWYNAANDALLLNSTTEIDFAAFETLNRDHQALYTAELPEWPANYFSANHATSPILLNFSPKGAMAATWNAAYWEVPDNPYDLSVRTTLAPDSQAPKPGNTITYQLEIRNVGYFSMTGVTFADTLPDDVVYLGASPAPNLVDGNDLEWDLGTIAAESPPVVVQIQATIPGAVTHGTPLLNRAEVWSAEPDGRTGNNLFLFELEVREDVDLAVIKSGVGQPAVGEDFTYYIDYYNWGGARATDVLITDTLPVEVSFISAQPAPTAMSGQVLTWSIVSVPGSQWGGQIEITAEIVDAGLVTNTAEIAYDDVETIYDNNVDLHVEDVDDILAPVILRPTQGSTDETPTIYGLAPSFAIVDIWDISNPALPTWVVSVTANTSGEFEVEPTLGTGTYVLVATASKAGLDSAYSNAATITVKDNLPLDPDFVTIKAGDVDVSAGSVEAERNLLPMRNLTVQAELACGLAPTPTLRVTENALFMYHVPPTEMNDLGGGMWDVSFTFWLAEPHSSYEMFLEWECGTEHEEVLLMFILIDPDGFVYDQGLVDGGSAIEDALILDATVTCYVKVGDSWLSWPAGLYGQVNPQSTDGSTDDGVLTAGYYSFLTPSGQYRIRAEAPGYQPYESGVLTVITKPVHLDVGMAPIVVATAQTKSPANLANSQKQVNTSLAWVGDELTYDIWLENSGESQSDLLSMIDAIPSRTTYVSNSLVVDGGSGGYDSAAEAIEWEGSIGANDAIHVQYKVVVASTPGTPFTVLNEAQVSGAAANLASLPGLTAATLVQNEIDLALEKDEQQTVDSGSTAVYSHTLTNKGNFTDTFEVSAVSSHAWSTQTPSPIELGPGQGVTVQVGLLVPAGVVSGTFDTMTVTAMSLTNNAFSAAVANETTVLDGRYFVYLPALMKD